MNKRQKKKFKSKYNLKRYHDNSFHLKRIQKDILDYMDKIWQNQILFGTAMVKVEWDGNSNIPGIKVLSLKEMIDYQLTN